MRAHDQRLISLSVVIPTKNSSRNLPRLLQSVKTQAGGPWEVIVIDNWSTDDTVEIARNFTANVFLAGPERSSQRNYGAARATGNALVFLDSDMELTQGVLAECRDKLSEFDALCLRELIMTGGSYWTAVRAFERDSNFGSKVYEAARALRKGLFESLGGYDENLTGLEDMDLQAKLTEHSSRIGWVSRPILHHEEEVNIIEYLRKRRRYGRDDAKFARRHPNYWSAMRSPVKRFGRLVRNPRGRPLSSTLTYLPGVLVLRGAEYFVRSVKMRGSREPRAEVNG